jgi:hypothetical protein
MEQIFFPFTLSLSDLEVQERDEKETGVSCFPRDVYIKAINKLGCKFRWLLLKRLGKFILYTEKETLH